MGSGTIVQLQSQGVQDEYLTGTGNTVAHLWTAVTPRHTNFAIESIENTFNGQADFGRKVTCPISRNGDLAYRTYLQVTLPEINQLMGNLAGTEPVYARWLDFPGEQLISQVELEIGGQRIDRQYGDFMHIWNQLTMTAEQQRGYYKMIGHTTQLTYITDPHFADVDGPCDASAPKQVCAPRNTLPETTLYIPLQFWFCTNPGLALPILAIAYHEIKLNVEFRPIDECLWAVTSLTGAEAGSNWANQTNRLGRNTSVAATVAYQQSLVSVSLYVDYVFLADDERRRITSGIHQYLMTQLQFTGDESIGSSSNKIKLNFNHPVQELIWVVQPDANIDYCSATRVDAPLYKLMGAQPFNYTDALDVLPNAIHAYGGPQSVDGFINAEGLLNDPGATDINHSATGGHLWSSPGGAGLIQPGFAGSMDASGNFTEPTVSGVSDAGTYVLSETALDMHCWGQNPVVVAKFQINGQDRFSDREGSYFNYVQPYECHTRTPDEGINVYSFALRPEEIAPTGSLNFSRIDNATLQLAVSNAAVEGTNTSRVRVYATNWQVFKVKSGMGGIAFAS